MVVRVLDEGKNIAAAVVVVLVPFVADDDAVSVLEVTADALGTVAGALDDATVAVLVDTAVDGLCHHAFYGPALFPPPRPPPTTVQSRYRFSSPRSHWVPL